MPSIVVGGVNFQEARPELLAVGPVVRPRPGRLDEFARGDQRRVPHDGDEIALAACLHPQDAKAVVRVVERDALDEAGEVLLGRCGRNRRVVYD